MLKLVLVLGIYLSGFAQAHLSRSDLSDEKHYSESGVHNPKFDHEAFLGKDLASKLEGESFDSNKKRLIEIFAKIDTDKNGTVSEPEMYDWVKKVAKESMDKDAFRRWKEVNPESKNSISFTDFLESAYGKEETMPKDTPYWFEYQKMKQNDERRWKAADIDKDNKLSFEEYKAIIHPEDFDYMRDIVIDETIEAIDKDNDGIISLDEYLTDFGKTVGREPLEEGKPRPDWATKEANNFEKFLDKDHDGKMNREEVGHWVMPKDYDPYEAEVNHLFYHADESRDKQLDLKEILDHQDTFIGSQATNYGQLHSDEL